MSLIIRQADDFLYTYSYIHRRRQWHPHSSTVARKIPWMEEPGRLQSMGSHRVRHDWSDLAVAVAVIFIYTFWKVCVKWLSSVQWLSHVRLWEPMNRTRPGLPVHHQLPESTQTHVHCVDDAIQPSHPLSSTSALNLSQHQSLFKWVSSFHQVDKVLEFQLQHQYFQWTPRTDLL